MSERDRVEQQMDDILDDFAFQVATAWLDSDVDYKAVIFP